MLQQVMKSELDRRGLNYREAAEQIGVTQTTVMRILQGENVNQETLAKISDWSGISITALLGMEHTEGQEAVMNLIVALVEREPKLKGVFEEAYKSLLDGEISVDDIRDIAVYASYKLSFKR